VSVNKNKEESTIAEREAAFVAHNQIIKDSLALVKHKFIVMSGKGGAARLALLPIWPLPFQLKFSKKN